MCNDVLHFGCHCGHSCYIIVYGTLDKWIHQLVHMIKKLEFLLLLYLRTKCLGAELLVPSEPECIFRIGLHQPFVNSFE